MAVAYDTAQTPTTFTAINPADPWLPGNFTPAAGSNRLAILVFGFGKTSGAGDLTAVTLGGQACTPVRAVTSDGTWTSCRVFYLAEAGIAAMVGSAISATLAGGSVAQAAVVCFTLTGAVGTVSSVQSGGASGTTAQASASVASTADGLVVAGVMSDDQAGITASGSDDGGTLKSAVVESDTLAGAQYTAGTGGAINLSWSQASNGYSVQAFNVDGTGGGMTLTPAQAAAVLSGQGTSLGFTINMPDEV